MYVLAQHNSTVTDQITCWLTINMSGWKDKVGLSFGMARVSWSHDVNSAFLLALCWIDE